jgi:hypothetical protein
MRVWITGAAGAFDAIDVLVSEDIPHISSLKRAVKRDMAPYFDNTPVNMIVIRDPTTMTVLNSTNILILPPNDGTALRGTIGNPYIVDAIGNYFWESVFNLESNCPPPIPLILCRLLLLLITDSANIQVASGIRYYQSAQTYLIPCITTKKYFNFISKILA